MAPSNSPKTGQNVASDPVAGLVAFVDRLEAHVRLDGSGKALLSSRGIWTFSETLQHAAQSIGYSMTGYPKLSPIGLRSTLGRAAKHLFLRRGAMRHNLSAPVLGAPELDPRMADPEAVAALRLVVSRFADFVGPLQPHPIYGRCSKEQVASLQTMHLREHLPGMPGEARSALHSSASSGQDK
ncbi:DUF1569 domain-containing protein [Arthrobacter sp. ISL-48]|uniref:DUF1569 domain-containing protein n=1 Tax=Arthrobacter sp. ISL-48 TaxID=2819110 RepID=UPI001BE8EC6F|nr:DUF1569 domain-containing protein [Arthrobacter sp. ISL-48]MBT2532548.1 DUF1569 domain-containing protein [Arthrobacter sp. ISL-48]